MLSTFENQVLCVHALEMFGHLKSASVACECKLLVKFVTVTEQALIYVLLYIFF